MKEHPIKVVVDGEEVVASVEARRTLADFLRIDVGRTGVHLGCEHGVCGACTVIVDGDAIRSCLMFAVQANGTSITTLQGVAAADGTLHPVQDALHEEHGLQCGFCTPGIVMTLVAIMNKDPHPSTSTLRQALSGHLCRCTGYQGILRAVERLGTADSGSKGTQ